MVTIVSTPDLRMGDAHLSKVRHGIISPLPHDTVVSRSLQLYGEWMEQELDMISTFLQQGQSVVEFGGDYGAHALWMSQAVGGGGQVHVVEPRRLAFQYLCANMAINGRRNVQAHWAWLGREEGQARLIDLLPAETGEAGSRVQTMVMDGLGLESLSLLKVNVPGALVALLQGADAAIPRHRPIVYFRLGSVERSISEVQLLKDLGYRCWSHLPYLYNPENFVGNRDDVFPGCVHQNVVAAPREASWEFERLREI